MNIYEQQLTKNVLLYFLWVIKFLSTGNVTEVSFFKAYWSSKAFQLKSRTITPGSKRIASSLRRFIPDRLLFSRAYFRFNLHDKCKHYSELK